MGRSVSYPSGAFVAFQDVSEEDSDTWSDYVDNVRDMVREMAPSFYAESRWIGREDRAILANSFAYVGVSEYCGLAAIWLVVREDSDAPTLAESWTRRFAPNFLKTFGQLRLIGRASNGEAFFERVNG